ncbi:MAG: lysoplasmalogenase [Clostridia bacterium]
MTFYKIMFALLLAAEAVVVPLFLKHSWPNKTWKSFTYKAIASGIFLLTGALSIQISGNLSTYAKYIMIGLILGAIGDVFLHAISKNQIWFLIGGISFLFGHICYINAFQLGINKYYPDIKFIEWYEILAVAIFLALFVSYMLIKQKDMKKLVAPMAVYAAIIGTMVVKSVGLFATDWLWGMRDGSYLPVALTVVLGAFLFISSDITLVILMFKSQKKNRPLKIYNIYSYYIAQILLGCSTFLVWAN